MYEYNSNKIKVTTDQVSISFGHLENEDKAIKQWSETHEMTKSLYSLYDILFPLESTKTFVHDKKSHSHSTITSSLSLTFVLLNWQILLISILRVINLKITS